MAFDEVRPYLAVPRDERESANLARECAELLQSIVLLLLNELAIPLSDSVKPGEDRAFCGLGEIGVTFLRLYHLAVSHGGSDAVGERSEANPLALELVPNGRIQRAPMRQPARGVRIERTKVG